MTNIVVFGVILHEIVESTHRNMTQYQCPLDAVEFALLVWVISSILHLLENVMHNGKAYWSDFWNVYSTFNTFAFAVAYGVWFTGFITTNEGKILSLA